MESTRVQFELGLNQEANKASKINIEQKILNHIGVDNRDIFVSINCGNNKGNIANYRPKSRN